jgi:small subunit ribosomal protein S2
MTSKTVDLKSLLAAGLHFGHKTAKWNPKMKPYLFGERNGIHIFDLEKTAEKLETALKFLEKSASEGKTILLVSTKQQTVDSLPDLAASLDLPYVTRWYGGLLTNWNTTKQRLKHFRDLKAERAENNFAKYTKAEANQKMKEIVRLAEVFAGIENLERKPDVVFVLDAVRDALAVREAGIAGIPTVGVADSNCDPTTLTYPIPGNDDAIKAINLILGAIHDAIEHGQKNPKKPEPRSEKKTTEKTESEPAKAEEKTETAEKAAETTEN